MAFKYQVLNESRTSLTSLSSVGSSRSIDSIGNRLQPRLEFSAAGTTSRSSRSSEERSRSLSKATSGGVDVSSGKSEWRLVRDGQTIIQNTVDGDSIKRFADKEAVTTWPTSANTRLKVSYVSEDDSTYMYSGCHMNPANSSRLDESNGFSERVSTKAQKVSLYSTIESETGLYIHSSVRSGGSGLRFSRQDSAERQAGGPNMHSRDHGKLRKVLQRFSNKRAQQRVEMEAEKRARKSPWYNSGTQAGREKENVGHQQRAHKVKQGKKGRVPVSKSSDLLSSFSDVVCRESSELEGSRSASTEGLLLIGIGDELSSGCGGSRVDHNHHHGQQCPDLSNTNYGDALTATTNKYQVPVKRSSSLNERIYHSCYTETLSGATGTFHQSCFGDLNREITATK